MRQLPNGAGCGRSQQVGATEQTLRIPKWNGEVGRRERRHGAGYQRLSANAFLAMLLYHLFSMEDDCETGLRYHRDMTAPAGLFLGLNLPSSGPPPAPVLYHFHQYIP